MFNKYCSRRCDLPSMANPKNPLTPIKISFVSHLEINIIACIFLFSSGLFSQPVDSFTIFAKASGNGVISPSGFLKVDSGGTQSYSITPNVGNHVTDVFIRSWLPSQIIDASCIRKNYEGGNSGVFKMDGSFAGAAFYYANTNKNYVVTIDSSRAEIGLFEENIRVGDLLSYEDVAGSIVLTFSYPNGTIMVTFNDLGMIVSGWVHEYLDQALCSHMVIEGGINGYFIGPVSSYTFSNVDSNYTIYATFEIDKHSVTVSKTGAGTGTVVSNPAGILCGTSCFAQFDYGTSLIISAMPDNGTSFAGWSGNCSGTEDCSFIVNGDKSITANFIPGLYAPILVLPQDNSTGVSLSPVLIWKKVTGADYYSLQVSTDINFITKVIDLTNLSDTSSMVNGFSQNTKYYWRVNAHNNDGVSRWSLVWSFTTLIIPLPSKPTLVSPTNNATNIVLNPTLVWNKANGADTYRLVVTDGQSFSVTDSNLTDTSYSISGLLNNTQYRWRVFAVNISGYTRSDLWYFTTIPPAPNETVEKPSKIDFFHAKNLYSSYIT